MPLAEAMKDSHRKVRFDSGVLFLFLLFFLRLTKIAKEKDPKEEQHKLQRDTDMSANPEH